jgi:hypothetical protein
LESVGHEALPYKTSRVFKLNTLTFGNPRLYCN